MNNIWIKVPGYCTPGGDPVWACPNCKGTEHVNGIEIVNHKKYCEFCGQRNYYPWEADTLNFRGNKDECKNKQTTQNA